MTPDVTKICALLLNENKELMIVRQKGKDIWIALGGKIESGETEEECLAREIKEETGLELTKSKYYFTAPIEESATKPGVFVELKYYIVETTGEIKINPEDQIEEVKWIAKAWFLENEAKPESSKVQVGSGLRVYAIPRLIEEEMMK